MRWNYNQNTDRDSTFRTDKILPEIIGFAALRLRANKYAHTGKNPTHVPPEDRGDSDSTPVS